MIRIERPAPAEFAPYYASYVDRVPAGHILHILAGQRDETLDMLGKVGEERADHRYALGKWSIKEVLGHVIDTERLFAFRALWFARCDPASQPGMDQDAWVTAGRFDERNLADLMAEFRAVREASLTLFRGFSTEDWARSGEANQSSFSVRSFPFIIAGHELHHVQVLQARYI